MRLHLQLLSSEASRWKVKLKISSKFSWKVVYNHFTNRFSLFTFYNQWSKSKYLSYLCCLFIIHLSRPVDSYSKYRKSKSMSILQEKHLTTGGVKYCNTSKIFKYLFNCEVVWCHLTEFLVVVYDLM